MGTAGTKGVPRAERERQILDAATEEFGRHGYAGTSLAAVAARSGVSKPMVLAYFSSKDGLYAACVRRAGDNLTNHIETAMADGASGLQLPALVFTAIFAALEPRPNDWNVIWDRGLPEDGNALAEASRVRQRLIEQASRGVAVVGEAGKRTVDADDLAVLTEVWTGMVSSVVRWWLRHPEQSAPEMAARCLRIVDLIADAGVRDRQRTP
ncbi:TetR/AcrR family transcriptional regulator [Nocardia cyriacigeorgica]|uniref:TetR/AcrR family transcriptional regulator n=1 Tax=Nocardia cyriacigeorgica TaxID=135487 RepID=UPI0024582AD9|nr:TetR/AcrR family transcriptional regulator [Nocardia cyriacigeorgica]